MEVSTRCVIFICIATLQVFHVLTLLQSPSLAAFLAFVHHANNKNKLDVGTTSTTLRLLLLNAK